MSLRRSRLLPMVLWLGTFLGACLGTGPAHAFCGFFVSGASDSLRNTASQVVLLRDGNRTFMTMSNNYQGPPQDFAMVVPVPVILQKEQVKTLDRAILRKLDELSAPRLVEYWEQDPCRMDGFGEGTIGLGNLGTIGRGAGGSGAGYGSLGVRIEAQFSVGEYEILILSAEESGGLEKWLHLNHYKIPPGSAAALAPYIRDQMKFFVAKVNIQKVKRDSHGHVVLSPLRFSFDAAELRLPVRLGLLNAQGAQDLLVYILHASRRFEVANYTNVFIPSNVEVADSVRKNFPAFYAELFDATLQKSGGKAVVTEYAWDTGSCDPCPTPPLSSSDLATLGAGGTDGGGSLQTYGDVAMGTLQATGALDPELIRRVVRRHFNELRFCYEKQLAINPAVTGKLELQFDINAEGQVTSSVSTLNPQPQPDLQSCMAGAARRWEFPRGQSHAAMSFTLQARQRRVNSGFGRTQQTYVLTRLHTRYDRQTLSSDLIFRMADPVTGGRANFDGTLGDPGAQPAPGGVNNFQGRYVIRHYWEGKVSCQNPRYGLWGGPPPGSGTAPGRAGQAQAGVDLANAPRGQVSLPAVIQSPLPSLGIAGQPRPARR